MKKKKQITCAAGLQKRPGRSEKAPPHVLREQRSLAEAESLKRQLSFPSPLSVFTKTPASTSISSPAKTSAPHAPLQRQK